MSTDHVVALGMRAFADCPQVTGLLPLLCKPCGERVHIGVPIAVSSLVTLTQAFTAAHAGCKGES
jgi:hypothetical protein